MFDRGLTFLTFGPMIRVAGSHRTFTSTSGFQGPGARDPGKGLVLQATPRGLVVS